MQDLLIKEEYYFDFKSKEAWVLYAFCTNDGIPYPYFSKESWGAIKQQEEKYQRSTLQDLSKSRYESGYTLEKFMYLASSVVSRKDKNTSFHKWLVPCKQGTANLYSEGDNVYLLVKGIGYRLNSNTATGVGATLTNNLADVAETLISKSLEKIEQRLPFTVSSITFPVDTAFKEGTLQNSKTESGCFEITLK